MRPREVPRDNMQKDFHQQIGALISVSPTTKKVKYGTGVLISPDLVLTVAHNIFDMGTRHDYQELKFYPGQYGKL